MNEFSIELFLKNRYSKNEKSIEVILINILIYSNHLLHHHQWHELRVWSVHIYIYDLLFRCFLLASIYILMNNKRTTYVIVIWDVLVNFFCLMNDTSISALLDSMLRKKKIKKFFFDFIQIEKKILNFESIELI